MCFCTCRLCWMPLPVCRYRAWDAVVLDCLFATIAGGSRQVEEPVTHICQPALRCTASFFADMFFDVEVHTSECSMSPDIIARLESTAACWYRVLRRYMARPGFIFAVSGRAPSVCCCTMMCIQRVACAWQGHRMCCRLVLTTEECAHSPVIDEDDAFWSAWEGRHHVWICANPSFLVATQVVLHRALHRRSVLIGLSSSRQAMAVMLGFTGVAPLQSWL